MTRSVTSICVTREFRSSVSRDITFLVCQVISQDHLINGLCDFVSGCLTWQVTTLPSLVVMDIVIVEIRFQWLKSYILHVPCYEVRYRSQAPSRATVEKYIKKTFASRPDLL